MRGGRLPDRTASAQLDIREYRDAAGPRHVVSLKGEVDISNGSRVESWIAQVIDDGASDIVVSLSGLWFIDASGLRSLVACSQLCESCGVSFALTPLQGTVKRVFALTGLDRLFTFTEL
jgi:anti-sigma B factor antagonist